jgi:hypothetical protein
LEGLACPKGVGRITFLKKCTEKPIALAALILFAAWLFIALPLIYAPSAQSAHGEFLGVKYGEWLLFLATLILAWTTWMLVRGAELTAERQLRAYVIVTSKGLDEQGEAHERYVHQLEIRNTGQTPAYDVQIVSYTNSLAHPLPPEFHFPTYDPNQNPSIMTLGAGLRAEQASFADQVLDEAEMMRIKSAGSGRRLYCYGTVKYHDVFNRQRHTNFCHFFEWSFENLPANKLIPRISVHPSQRHNDAS